MKELIDRHGGRWGVYQHDCYKCDEQTKVNAFVDAFESYIEALKFCTKINGAIHIIPRIY